MVAFNRGSGGEMSDGLLGEGDGNLAKPNLPPKFSLGQVVATPGALAAVTQRDILVALHRHQGGDWGLVDKEDWEANNRALLESTRLVSAYKAVGGERFWIITEADRSSTCALLPEEY